MSLPDRELQPAWGCLESQDNGPRIQAQALRVREATAIRSRELKFKVRRILMIGGDEGPARHSCEGLQRMCMAVGRAVLQDQIPGQAPTPASVPSWGSVADPEKLITSPTFQVVPAAGVDDGGRRVLPTVIVTEAVSEPPRCR